MIYFLTTLAFTLVLFIGAALVFNYCKRRTARSRHPLSGMCQKDGGTMCCSCSSAVQAAIQKR
jgi:hypothetical protein